MGALWAHLRFRDAPAPKEPTRHEAHSRDAYRLGVRAHRLESDDGEPLRPAQPYRCWRDCRTLAQAIRGPLWRNREGRKSVSATAKNPAPSTGFGVGSRSNRGLHIGIVDLSD